MLNYLRGFVILLLLLPAGLHAATIALPKTGQTGCWDSSGNPIACTDTGQDGAKLEGVSWPTPRFTNPNGSTPVTGNIVVDQLTGLVWAKDISAPTSTWQGALDTVAAMNAASGTFGYTDWRLPTRQELFSLVDRQQPDALPAGHPFTNVPSGKNVWSSTTYDYQITGFPLTNLAWTLFLPDGYLDGHTKNKTDSAVWPVRGGQFGTSVISALPASKDYGSVGVGSSASQAFTISNTAGGGSSNLAVNSIVLSGTDTNQFSVNVGNGSGGTCGSFAPVVAAGANCTITVSFNPVSLGSKSASLRVSGSDVNTPNVDIALSGTGGTSGPTVTASVSGGNGIISSTNPLSVTSGAAASFTLLPDDGYRPNSVVTGTCPAGSFTGLTYTTGAVTTTCTVIFSFETIPQNSVVINGGNLYTNSKIVTLALSAAPTPAYMSFQLNGKTWTKPEPFSASKTVTLPATNGLRTVSVHYLASLTDTSPALCSSTITLDTKKPTGKILINNGDKTTTNTHVTLTLTATDLTSGVASMRFSTDKLTWSDWEEFAATKGYDLTPGAGTKKVYVQYQDRAGNLSSAYSDSIKVVPEI